MDHRYQEIGLPTADATHSRAAAGFLITVYMWMFAGLSLTTVVAFAVAGSRSVIMAIAGSRALFFGLVIAELALVLVLSMAINRISAGLATLMFLLYSALNGVTLSFILLAYTGQSVAVAFLSAGCLFGTLSLYGYITKRDLTALGSLMTVGLLAVIVCMVINMFLGSSGFDYLISLVGVVVFLGLTAHDTQKILRLGAGAETADAGALRKGAVIGALALYLDFINLFLYMLRFVGKRK